MWRFPAGLTGRNKAADLQGEGQEHGWILQSTGKGDVLGVRAESSSLGEPGHDSAASGPGLPSGGQPWTWFGTMEPSKLLVLNPHTSQGCSYPVRLSHHPVCQ